MPYYRTQTYTTTGTFGSWNLDNSIVPFNASVAITPIPASSTGTVTLQYTLNPLNGPLDTDASANWINSSLNTSIGTTTVVSFSNPISRIRLIIGTAVATSFVMEMNQGLSTN